ncbi:MAG TPA: NHL repeat-containing protein [Rudaea sp.]|nr:NHL repeat-containing protein [Rudaea sp.]
MSNAFRRARAQLALGVVLAVTAPVWADTTTDVAQNAGATPAGMSVIQAPVSGFVSLGYRSIHFTDYVGGFNLPFHITADNDTFFVSNIGTNTVLLYQITAPGLVYLRTFGSGAGAGAGQFNGPEQVAVVGNDVYVADFSNNRIQRFNKSTGAYVSQFGTPGTGAGQLSSPSGLVYNPANGFLYVSETGNDRISVFSTVGTYQFQFASPGSGNGQLNNPYVLAIDSNNNIYAADMNNNRIVKFDPAGAYIRNIANGVLSPAGLAVDKADLNWVTSSGSNDSYSYDARGNYVSYYYGAAPPTWAQGYFQSARSLAVTSPLPFAPYNGTPAVVVADLGSNNVQVFSRSLQATAHPVIAPIAGLSGFIGGVAFDSAQNVYLTAFSSNAVYKFDKFGNFLLQWGSAGSGNGQFSGAYGICVDDAGNVYVADSNNDRIQKFDSSGSYLLQWGTTGSGNGQFNSPGGIATDGTWIYVSDESNNRVQKFSLTGGYVRQWGTNGSGNGQFQNPAGIAVDRNRQQVYVAEYGNSRVQQFSVFGDFIKVFADSTSGSGTLTNPVGLATDQHGNIYVADRGNNRVVQYNDNGTYLSNFAQASANAIGTDMRNGQIYVGASSGGTVSRYGAVVGKSDGFGVYRPATQTFLLRNTPTPGAPNITATVASAQATDIPVTGDWNGDGIDTPGLYRPGTSTFYLWDRWSNLSIANAEYVVIYGVNGDRPVVGDWDGDGKDSLGTFRPSTNTFFLRNALTAGAADYMIGYGAAGDRPLGGDWNQDGESTIGLYRASDGKFHISNRNVSGAVADDGAYALGAAGDLPIVGDWTHSGYSALGMYRPATGNFTLKYNLDSTPADATISFDGDRVFTHGFEVATSAEFPLAGSWGSAPE